MVNLEAEFYRFKKDTGIDFFDLMNGKQMVFRIGTDTDSDEKEHQQFYEPFQKVSLNGN